MSLARSAARLAAAALALAALGAAPAHADIKGDSHVQAANVQAEPGLQLDSAAVQKVFCQLKKTGANHVALNPTYVQDTPTSTVITRRPGKKGVEPSPTEAQLRQAIRNARACSLGVIIKPHLELADSSWRAKIVGSDAWQAEWTRVLVRLAVIARQENADTLVIGVEQKGASLPKGSAARWKRTIADVRAAAAAVKTTGPKLRLTYAFHTGDELLLADPSWVKKLDFVCATWYPRVPKEGATYTELKAKLRVDKGEFDSAWRRYGKPLQFCETGLRSLEWDHRFAKAGSLEYAAAAVDLGVQERWYHAFLHVVDGWDHVDGVMFYRVLNSPSSGGPTDKGFTFQGKPAEATVARYFGGTVPWRG